MVARQVQLEGSERPEARPEAAPSRPEAVRREIAETRARIGQTLDEIQHRLSPRNLKQQAMAAMKRQSRQAGERMTGAMRANPLPALIAGAGLSWWVVSAVRRRTGGPQRPRGRGGPVPTEADYELRRHKALYEAGLEPEAPYTSPEAVRGERGGEAQSSGGGSRQRMEQARQQAQAAGEQARQRAGEWSHQAQERASEAMGYMSGQASRAGETLRRGTRGATESTQEAYEQHPLSMGVAAFAAGLLAGLIIPSTRQEDRWMGSTRDKMMRQAREYSEQLWDQGQEVARAAAKSAGETATEEAKERGLGGSASGQEESQQGAGGGEREPGESESRA